MKKIFLSTTIITIAFILLSMKKDPPGTVLQGCSTTEQSYQVYNFSAIGDQLLNVASFYSISDMTSRGYIASLSIKANTTCSYSWSKTYTNSDPNLTSNTFWNVPIPFASNYTVTLSIESGCVYDNWTANNVKFVWKKSIESTSISNSVDLGFPTKAYCAIIKSISDRQELISIYEDEGRIASSSTRLLPVE